MAKLSTFRNILVLLLVIVVSMVKGEDCTEFLGPCDGSCSQKCASAHPGGFTGSCTLACLCSYKCGKSSGGICKKIVNFPSGQPCTNGCSQYCSSTYRSGTGVCFGVEQARLCQCTYIC